MVKIGKAQRFSLYAVVVLVIVGGYVYWIYLPKEKEFDKLAQDRNDKEVQLRRMPIQQRNYERLKREMGEIENKLTGAKVQLSKEKEIPDLIRDIDSKGKESNIDFLYFKPQAIVTREFYREVPIVLNVKGKFHDVALFLNKLAGLPRLISVSNIKMFEMPEKDGNVAVRAEMIAKSYVCVEGK